MWSYSGYLKYSLIQVPWKVGTIWPMDLVLVYYSHSYAVFHHKLEKWQEGDLLWVEYLKACIGLYFSFNRPCLVAAWSHGGFYGNPTLLACDNIYAENWISLSLSEKYLNPAFYISKQMEHNIKAIYSEDFQSLDSCLSDYCAAWSVQSYMEWHLSF